MVTVLVSVVVVEVVVLLRGGVMWWWCLHACRFAGVRRCVYVYACVCVQVTGVCESVSAYRCA